MTEIIQTSDGYVLRCIEGRHVAYQGRDGYWARFIRNAMPFSTMKEANAATIIG